MRLKMILILAYCAVILSLLSGFLALLTRQRDTLLRLGLSGLEKIPNSPQRYLNENVS